MEHNSEYDVTKQMSLDELEQLMVKRGASEDFIERWRETSTLGDANRFLNYFGISASDVDEEKWTVTIHVAWAKLPLSTVY